MDPPPPKKSRRLCIEPGCDKFRQRFGRCCAHGGHTPCQHPDCTLWAVKKGVCWTHYGDPTKKYCQSALCLGDPLFDGYCELHCEPTSRMCSFPDCSKWSEVNHLCREHGGVSLNKTCKYEGCNKCVQKDGFCREHGGLKTCSVDGCARAPKGQGKCITHGGFTASMLCQHEGCTKFKQLSGFCKEHGPTCTVDGCITPAADKSMRCTKHGGRKRCESGSCGGIPDPYARGYATYRDLETNVPMCWSCFGAKYPQLTRAKVRIEHLILAELQRRIPELVDPLVWDCPIPGQACSGEKPDMAWIIDRVLLHVEIDERGSIHEDDDGRLASILSAAQHAHGDNIIHRVIRFCPDRAVQKLILSNGETAWQRSRKFDEMMDEFERIARIAVVGDDIGEEGWKAYLFFS